VQAYYDANKSNYMTPETVGLQYVELKLSDVASEVAVTEEALRAHYDQIKDKFSAGERRHAHHILITTGNGVDDATARKQADDLYAKLKSGADFETLARENSKDPGSAVKGGDLGWAKRGDFVKPFEDALFSMNPGEIRGPVKSDFGYHIIRLDEVEGSSKTFEQVRSEVEADYRNEQAHSLFYDRTQKFADAAFSKMNELDSVAKEFNTTVKTIPNFTREGGGEFTKGSPVIDAAFSEAVLEKGQNSPLVTIGEERAIVVRINDHKLPEQKSLDQVRGEIVALLKDQAAKVAAEQKATELVKQLKDGSVQWSAIAKQPAVTLGTKQTIGRNGSTAPQAIVSAAFGMPKGTVTAGKSAYASTVLDNGDYAIVAVSAVKSGAEVADAKQSLQTVEAQQAMQTGRAEFAGYVQELKRTAKIEINPAAFD
jgi:peptidyl-prolyl cis-trans isomerase D